MELNRIRTVVIEREREMSCSSSSGWEDENEGVDSYRKGGYYAVRVGHQFNGGRHIAQRKLGWGQFSTVWLAYDTSTSVASHLFLNYLFIFFFNFSCFIWLIESFDSMWIKYNSCWSYFLFYIFFPLKILVLALLFLSWLIL